MKQEDKANLCVKWYELLLFIGFFNKGYILRTQLEEYCMLLTDINTKYKFETAIRELSEGQIIKQISLMDTNNNIVMLKKYGIAFLKGEIDPYNSRNISAIKPCSTSDRYLRNIMYNEYILSVIKKSDTTLEKTRNIGITELFKKNNVNFFMNTAEYCEYLISHYPQSTNENYLEAMKANYWEEKEKIKKATEISRMARLNPEEYVKPSPKENKGVYGKKTKEQRDYLMLNGTFETLRKKGSYIRFLKKKDYFLVSLFFMDYKNKQDFLSVSEHVALLNSILDKVFKTDITFKIEVVFVTGGHISKSNTEILDTIKKNLKLYFGIKKTEEDWLQIIIKQLDIDKYLNKMPVINSEVERFSRKNKELEERIKKLEKLLKDNKIEYNN